MVLSKSSVDPALASSILVEAKEWTEEKTSKDYSFILECARTVLANRSAGHEEQMECIHWLSSLSQFVPTFDIEIGIIKPMLTAVNEFLDKVYEFLGDEDGLNGTFDVEMKSDDRAEGLRAEFFFIVSNLLIYSNTLVQTTELRSNCGAGDVPSLLRILPKILCKTFHMLGKVSSPSTDWMSSSRRLINSFLKVLENLQIRASFDDELQLLHNIMSDLLSISGFLLHLEPTLMFQSWNVFIKFTKKFKSELPPWLSEPDLQLANAAVEKMVDEDVLDLEVFSSCIESLKVKQAGSTETVGTSNQPSSFGGHSAPVPLGKVPKFFILSESFPITPIALDSIQKISLSILETPPPDLGGSFPIPASKSSFFILSSLCPIPVQSLPKVTTESLKDKDITKRKTKLKVKKQPKLKVNEQPKLRVNKRAKLKKDKQAKLPNFEKKVLRSKLLNANLQKQRLGNMQRFKTLISEERGIFRCNLCGTKTGYGTKAWNHASRCGLQRKKNKKIKKFSKCGTCDKEFSSKKGLVKHFRANHQRALYICALCPTPRSFKFKYSLKRHHALKHTKTRSGFLFKCIWCSYRATQRANLKRHIGRKHKSVAIVSNMLDLILSKAVDAGSSSVDFEEIGLCEYERIRLKNMRRNQEMLDFLFPREEISCNKPKNRTQPAKKILGPSRKSPRFATIDSPGFDIGVHHGMDSLGAVGQDGDRTVPDNDGGEASVDIPGVNENNNDLDVIVTESVEEMILEGVEEDRHILEQHLESEESVTGDVITNKFQCAQCTFKSNHKHSLGRHVVKKHGTLDNNLPCPRKYCSQTFPTRYEKEIHVPQCFRICPREECNGKKFIRQDKFDQHTRMHIRMEAKMEE